MFPNWLFRRSPLGTSTAGACPNQNPRLCWFVVLVCSLLLIPLIHLYIHSSLVLFPVFENLRLVGMNEVSISMDCQGEFGSLIPPIF